MVFIAPLLSAAAIYATLVGAVPQLDNFPRDGSPAPTSRTIPAMGAMISPRSEGGPYGDSQGSPQGDSQQGGGYMDTSVTMAATSTMKNYGGMGGVQTSMTMSTSYAVSDYSSMTGMGDSGSMSNVVTPSTSDAMSTAMNTYSTPTYSTPAYSTPTYSTPMYTYSTPMYGSGSSKGGDGGSGYQSCMQMCAASYGVPTMASSTWSAPPATTTAASGSGCTHTVIVAPTQGVLRYVPFALNASVGDTIAFVWNANTHTVTKSSELAICNKTSDMPFTSGVQNKSFVFTQKVNDTNTTFYYCGVPGHCQKGMFGIINPPNALMGSNATVSSMMPVMASNSSNMTAMVQYTQMVTANNTMAGNWGGNIDMNGMPPSSYQYMFENVMYTRTFLAANPEVLSADGVIDLSSAGTTPLIVPNDITAAATNSSTSSGSPTSGSPTAGATGSSPSPASTGGARSLGSSSILVSAVVASLVFVL